MIAGVQIKSVQKSRSGLTRMGKLTFEDLTGSTPAMLWPEEFAKFESVVKDDAIVFVKGTLDRRRDPAELIISRVIPIERADAELATGVVVSLRKGPHGDAERPPPPGPPPGQKAPGNLKVYFEVFGLAGVRRAIYKAGTSLRLRHDERLYPTWRWPSAPATSACSAPTAMAGRQRGHAAAPPAPRPEPADGPRRRGGDTGDGRITGDCGGP